MTAETPDPGTPGPVDDRFRRADPLELIELLIVLVVAVA
jgi:hypothetical protein